MVSGWARLCPGSIAVNPIGASDCVLLKRAPLEEWAELHPAWGRGRGDPKGNQKRGWGIGRVRRSAPAPALGRAVLIIPEGLSAKRVLGGLPHRWDRAPLRAWARRALGMLAVPDRLEVGSRKPELGTNRLTTWPAKNPLDQRLQDPRGLEQIPNPQAEFSET